MTKQWPSDRLGRSKIGDEWERFAKCKRCLAFYSPGYAEKAGGHRCDEMILGLVKRKRCGKRLKQKGGAK